MVCQWMVWYSHIHVISLHLTCPINYTLCLFVDWETWTYETVCGKYFIDSFPPHVWALVRKIVLRKEVWEEWPISQNIIVCECPFASIPENNTAQRNTGDQNLHFCWISAFCPLSVAKSSVNLSCVFWDSSSKVSAVFTFSMFWVWKTFSRSLRATLTYNACSWRCDQPPHWERGNTHILVASRRGKTLALPRLQKIILRVLNLYYRLSVCCSWTLTMLYHRMVKRSRNTN